MVLAFDWNSVWLLDCGTHLKQDRTKVVYTTMVPYLLYWSYYSDVRSIRRITVGWHCDGTLGSGPGRRSTLCLGPVVHG